MKLIAGILSVLVATALMFGAIVLVVIRTPRISGGLIVLATVAITVFVYGPLVLGSITAYWNVRKTQESRRYFRRWFIVVLGLELLGAAAIAIYAALSSAPTWLPVLFIGGAIVLLLVALLVGRQLLRHDEANPSPERTWNPIGREEIRRKILIVAITFAGVLVLGIVGFALLLVALGDSRDRNLSGVGVTLAFATEFAFIAAAMACALVTLPLNRRLREALGRDFGQVRTIGKVVLRQKKLDLDEAGQVAAARYAVIVSITLPFQLAYISLLYLGIAIQQVQALMSGNDSRFGSGLSIGVLIALVVVLVVYFPLFARRISRARAYARDHAQLVDADD